MKSKGNSSPEQCVQNLCSITRGEVFGDRVKGVDGTLVDKHNISDELIEDIKWLVGEYEPRVSVDNISVGKENDEGNFVVTINTERKGEA